MVDLELLWSKMLKAMYGMLTLIAMSIAYHCKGTVLQRMPEFNEKTQAAQQFWPLPKKRCTSRLRWRIVCLTLISRMDALEFRRLTHSSGREILNLRIIVLWLSPVEIYMSGAKNICIVFLFNSLGLWNVWYLEITKKWYIDGTVFDFSCFMVIARNDKLFGSIQMCIWIYHHGSFISVLNSIPWIMMSLMYMLRFWVEICLNTKGIENITTVELQLFLHA